MSNGTWSDLVPTCSRGYSIHCENESFSTRYIIWRQISRVGAKCPLLPTIKNGFIVDTTREYLYGDEARVQCNRGYKLSGSNIIQCGPNQRFDNVPTCEGTIADIFFYYYYFYYIFVILFFIIFFLLLFYDRSVISEGWTGVWKGLTNCAADFKRCLAIIFTTLVRRLCSSKYRVHAAAVKLS